MLIIIAKTCYHVKILNILNKKMKKAFTSSLINSPLKSLGNGLILETHQIYGHRKLLAENNKFWFLAEKEK